MAKTNNNNNNNSFFTPTSGSSTAPFSPAGKINQRSQNKDTAGVIEIKFDQKSLEKISNPKELMETIKEHVKLVSGGDYFLPKEKEKEALINSTATELSAVLDKIKSDTYIYYMQVSIDDYKYNENVDISVLHKENTNFYDQIIETSKDIYSKLHAM